MNPELSVPGHGLFFSYSFDVIRHVSRHRRDCCTCQCQDKLSEFDKALMVSVFSRSFMDGALVFLTSLRIQSQLNAPKWASKRNIF